MNIPKIIHYCWFGKGEKSDLMKQCIRSWKKHMPDYEIIEWNEDNTTFDSEYAIEAYQEKKYAFVSDYIRLKVLYEHGGIYLDTDVELIKSLEPLLERGGFIGFERKNTVTTGLGFAAPIHSKTVKKMLEEYDGKHFIFADGIDNTPCPVKNTNALRSLGLVPNNTEQMIGDIIVYPNDYFCPMNYDSGLLSITPNTYSIHHYGYSWANDNDRRIIECKRKIFKCCPKWCAQFVFNVFNHFYLIRNKK